MCKKFFHPGNPENLERVYVARERVKAKEAEEVEKMREYEREQELWNNRKALADKTQKDKMSLSFMYDPPVGLRKEEKKVPKDPKDEFKFEWQKNAPREKHCKEDPNIVDHPFGINVQFTKCIRCQVWGHGHTDKHCPNYGKARDADMEPAQMMNERELIRGMKDRDKLKFTNYSVWDNGKTAKTYDMVYSSGEEGNDDIMSNLLKEIRGKEKRIEKLRSKVRKVTKKDKKPRKSKKTSKREKSPSKSDKSAKVSKSRKSSKSSPSTRHRRKRREEPLLPPPPADNAAMSEESKLAYLKQVDDILFSGIGNAQHSTSSSKTSSSSNSPVAGGSREDSSFLSEVDKILGLESRGNQSGSSDEDDDNGEEEESDSDNDNDSDNSDSDVPEEIELTESEMRLLNLIQINKIDVKKNFEEQYKDDLCHFCRTLEDSAHLAICPVYDDIMDGTEFTDIKSKDTGVVQKALTNIRNALLERSRALSVTSIGTISTENMKLLDLPVKTEKDERILKALAILDAA